MSLTDPVPPVPQHTPPVERKSGLERFTNNWMQWFLLLRDKINVINDSLVTLGLVTDPGLLAKQADGSWEARTIVGTTDRVTVSNGDGSGNPTIDIVDEGIEDIVAGMLVAGSNITLTYNDAAGTITIASSGGGGGAGNFAFVDSETLVASATSIEITGLDLDTDGTYYCEFALSNQVAAIAFLSMQLSGDTTATNYYTQQQATANAAVSASNANNASFAAINVNPDYITGTLRIMKGADDKVYIDIVGMRTFGYTYRSTVMWNSTSNLTSIKIITSQTNGFKTGDFLKIWNITT